MIIMFYSDELDAFTFLKADETNTITHFFNNGAANLHVSKLFTKNLDITSSDLTPHPPISISEAIDNFRLPYITVNSFKEIPLVRETHPELFI